MVKLENKENIQRIEMKPTAITKCAIGQDWYKHEFVIEFVPYLYYPDYMEIEKWIMNNIDGKELNIEEAVDMVHAMLKEFQPKYLCVKDYIHGNKVHFDVMVEK